MNKDASISFTICLKERPFNTTKQSGLRNPTAPELDKIEMEVWDGDRQEGVNLDLTIADLKALRRKMKITINEVEAWR